MTKTLLEAKGTLCFVFRQSQILVKDEDGKAAHGTAEDTPVTLPPLELYSTCLNYQVAHDWFGETAYGYNAMLLEDDAPVPPGWHFIPMRTLYAQNHPVAPLASRALGILNWRKETRFCSLCGGTMTDDKYETARNCMVCDRQVFPQLEPCIIVGVYKNGQILLAKHANRNTEVYTTIAGYMEPGESAEECVAREVFEETGIRVKNVRYVASQAWPFPDQLMLGFTAEYESGDISIQTDEIEDAKWFDPTNLPATPPKGSLAWRLIHGL